MLTEHDVTDKLLKFICSNFMVEPDDFSLEDSLVDQGVVDSIGLLEISTFIQEKFGIEVIEDDMNQENFGSLKKIVAFIIHKST